MTVLVALMVLANATASEVPRYEEYPAAEALRGKPAEPNFGSHPKARHYRTRLRQAARAGPNFAGHFTFVHIGCGTSCVQVAVVNSKDGSVFFPRGLRQVQWAGWWHHPCGPQYRLSSRLVVVYGAANEEEGRVPYGVSYFLWTVVISSCCGSTNEIEERRPNDGHPITYQAPGCQVETPPLFAPEGGAELF